MVFISFTQNAVAEVQSMRQQIKQDLENKLPERSKTHISDVN